MIGGPVEQDLAEAQGAAATVSCNPSDGKDRCMSTNDSTEARAKSPQGSATNAHNLDRANRRRGSGVTPNGPPQSH